MNESSCIRTLPKQDKTNNLANSMPNFRWPAVCCCGHEHKLVFICVLNICIDSDLQRREDFALAAASYIVPAYNS